MYRTQFLNLVIFSRFINIPVLENDENEEFSKTFDYYYENPNNRKKSA